MFTVQVLDLWDGHDAEVRVPTLQEAYEWVWRNITQVSVGTIVIYQGEDDEPILRMPVEDGTLTSCDYKEE